MQRADTGRMQLCIIKGEDADSTDQCGFLDKIYMKGGGRFNL